MAEAKFSPIPIPQQLVLVLGCPRSGIALTASQLACHPQALLLDGDGLPEAWLRNQLQGIPPEQALGKAVQQALELIHCGSLSTTAASMLILPLPQLLSEGAGAAAFLNSARARQLRPSLLEVVRDRDDVVSSLARFPHLQPNLPDPWEQQEAFVAAARGLWQRCRNAANDLRQAGWFMPQVAFADLVLHGPSGLWQAAALPVPSPGRPRQLHGISPSLCFRERTLDRSPLGRWHRQQPRGATTSTQRKSTILTPTLIATGRGGSGTRLLTLLLQGLGVNFGNSLNPTGDSVEWADLIYELCLARLGGRPGPWRRDWSEELHHRAACVAPGQPLQPWGWKLPEAMLVLPELSAAWPDTTLIHLVRHPLDTCLRRTHMTSRLNNPIGRATLRAAYSVLGLNSDPAKDPGYWRNAVSWWFQLQQLQHWQQANTNSGQRWIELRYEDLCQTPQAGADYLALRLGLPSKAVELPVNPARQRRWEAGDPRAQRVWELCAPVARRYGYEMTGATTAMKA